MIMGGFLHRNLFDSRASLLDTETEKVELVVFGGKLGFASGHNGSANVV